MNHVARDAGRMYMSIAYAVALAEARSCLAALADTAADFDESVRFEHLLLDLDRMHEPDYPALHPVAGNRAELVNRLESAVEDLMDMGADGLSLELLLARALGF